MIIKTNKDVEIKFEIGQIVASREIKKGCITIGRIEKIEIWPNGVVKYFVAGKDLDDFVIGVLPDLSNLINYATGY